MAYSHCMEPGNGLAEQGTISTGFFLVSASVKISQEQFPVPFPVLFPFSVDYGEIIEHRNTSLLSLKLVNKIYYLIEQNNTH